MIDVIWTMMIVLGVVTSVVMGRVSGLTDAVITGGKSAVELCMTMVAVVPLWSGVMAIAQEAGIVDRIRKIMMPVLKVLFKDVPENSSAMNYIAANLTANLLGLGWAATPMGIMAMKELKKLNKGSARASKAMCMFLIINMSSIQLVSVNLIAYRSSYGSISPAEITVPVIIATALSTLSGILYGKVVERRYKE